MNNQLLNRIILLLFFIQLANTTFSQITYGDSLSLKAEAAIQNSPFGIIIKWPADNDATSFDIYRKLKTSNSWGSSIASVSGTANQYVDLSVTSGVLYDYKIRMNTTTALAKHAYLSSGGYIVANSNRGIAILVVENSFLSNNNFQAGVNQLIEDIELDGWFPKVIYVNRNDSVQAVKSQIVAKYNENPLESKLLLIFGNVPVPFSGDIYPDGHADHRGAWPTDTYYADIDGTWTDNTINVAASSNALNHNIPYDGKFDNSYIASSVELQVGRVDLSNLSSSTNEQQLLLNYLNKLHRFKTAQINVQNKALIDDNFPSFAEGFSQSGYNNFAALVSKDSIVVDDYFTQLSYNTSTTGTYLWSYGCGGGSYASAGGIGSSSNFLSDSLSSVFTMLFGSYFGDWSYSDAFLRAAIAQGNTLTSAWAGRPHWFFQHMAMGDNIGYSAMLTQNNSSIYIPAGAGQQLVSINLMGEPSLRNNYPQQPLSLQSNNSGLKNYLTWTATSQPIDGYNIYRRYHDSTQFIKLNSALITSTNFIDSTFQLSGDTIYYYVKSVKTTTSPSGIYDNESLGVRATQTPLSVGTDKVTGMHNFAVYPNPFKESIFVKSTSDIAKIEITNYNGQLLKSIGNATPITEIELSNVPAGIYFVGMYTTDGFVSYQKVVKLK